VLAPVLVWENHAGVRVFNLCGETRDTRVTQMTAQVGPFLPLCDLRTGKKERKKKPSGKKNQTPLHLNEWSHRIIATKFLNFFA
jgi:hypothetical protein